jgi:anti-sigma B factor antagonist
MDKLQYLWRAEKMGWTWLTVPDVITMDNYKRIEDDVAAVISEGVRRIAVDLSNVHYLYSTAMGLFIRIQKRVSEDGGAICLVNVSNRVREVMSSVNLDKLFTIYTTDIEFEVSQGEVWDRRLDEKSRFIGIARVENGVCRINLSGFMTGANDLTAIDESLCSGDISHYVLDLTGLELIDSFGLGVLRKLLLKIREVEGVAIAYGIQESIVPLLTFMALDEYLNLYDNEREALESIGKA